MRHQSEAKQQRERDEGREAHHLTKHLQLTLSFVVQSHKHRLVHLFQHISH